MFHASRAPHGGLPVGVGAFGNAVWAQREPRCHRWRVWHTRVPDAAALCGDDWGFGATGVREPRRPLSRGGSDAVGLIMPDPD